MSKIFSIYVMLFTVLVSAKTIEVCNSCNYKTIKSAIASASDKDVILVRKGIYNEYDILINKEITIIGEKGATIDGGKKGEIIKISADNVTIENLIIHGVGVSSIADYAAIRISQSTNFAIRNNTLRDMFFGIYIAKSSKGYICNNTINGVAKDEYNSGNGIHLWYAQNIDIVDNYISGTRDGIYFEFADDCSIRNNVSTNNLRYGLHFMFSNHDEYVENKFYENGAGVAVMFSKFIDMRRNEFRQNWGTSAYGLLLKEIYDANLEDNIFEKNTIAIQVEGSTRINYFRNEFISNGWGVRVNGAAYENKFRHNNFSNNSFDLSYNSSVNDNEFTENYWGEYTGYDLDKDGFGDIPYRPVKLFSYIVDKTPEAVILLRSLFVDIINFSEKVSPVFTPDNLMDSKPLMQPFK